MEMNNIEEILKTIGAEDIPADVQRIAEQTSIDFDKTLTESRQPKQHIILKFLAKSQITRLAAAAVIGIGVLFALNIIGNGGGVAWGEVLDNVKKVQSYINRMKMKLTAGPKGSQDVELTFYRSTEYGTRRDSYFKDELISKLYVPAEGNKGIEVLPSKKEYIEVVFSDQQLKEMAEKNDPRAIVKEFMSCSYTELGSKTIDGIEVEGIEVDDPKFGSALFERGKGRLWVAVDTDLPVLIELEGVSAGGSVQINLTIDGFDWNADLQASDFEPNIPSDYTLMAKVDLSGNVEAVIKGLWGFAQITAGQYPSNLDIMTTGQEIKEAFIAMRKRQGKSLDEKPTREEMENILPIQGTCLFYGKLVKENKDVAYYGDKVTAQDMDKVLMRWKISDDEYRVIFGDLSTLDISAEKLAELEKSVLEQ